MKSAINIYPYLHENRTEWWFDIEDRGFSICIFQEWESKEKAWFECNQDYYSNFEGMI